AVIVGTILLRNWKSAHASKQMENSLDVGQPVQVLGWRENGTARVLYRGAEWDAEPSSADMPRVGTLYIEAVRGARLILSHRKSVHH
ncbi:MAG: NfeD family protein, partial [Gallionella sp.]|nr:NfeD family protein [Gallionella sp.]